MAQYKYQFTSYSFKQLQKLPKDIQKRVIKKLEYYCQENPIRFAEKLTDTKLGTYRLRIGNYRVIFDAESEDTITVVLVGDRKEIYR